MKRKAAVSLGNSPANERIAEAVAAAPNTSAAWKYFAFRLGYKLPAVGKWYAPQRKAVLRNAALKQQLRGIFKPQLLQKNSPR